ncbi:MAG TPA: hypothetical protein VM165_02145 [Planctomycetaceae bacterium]|nr:hypothetical protein [Planctomycetaceae bacterium]
MTQSSVLHEERFFECIEIYVPKKLEHLSELYNYLRQKLAARKAGVQQTVPIDGFSLYEVDGAFFGSEIYQERTVVVRILIDRAAEDDRSILHKIQTLGGEIATKVALSEEQLWIGHYPQGIVIVQPPGEAEK